MVTDGRPDHQAILALLVAGGEVCRVARPGKVREALERGECRAVVTLTDPGQLAEELGQASRAADFHRAGRELLCAAAGQVAEGDLIKVFDGIQEHLSRSLDDLLGRRQVSLYVLDGRTGRLERVGEAGPDALAEPTAVFADVEGNGIVGYVGATGRSELCDDLSEDPRYRPLGLVGARSSLTVPVMLAGKVLAVLTLESLRPADFTPADLEGTEVLADYVALSLHALRQVMTARYDAVSDTVRALTAELAGPLREIREEATSLTAAFIGHDEIRQRLGRIIETVDALSASVNRLAGEPTSVGLSIPAAAQPGEAWFTDKRILVADDEELIRTTICDVLSGAGAIVDAVVDGAEAERQIESGRYDLVISDIKMPHRDGYAVFAAAKRRNPDTAVILITGFGYDPNHSIVRANADGLSTVLYKPFKVNQLLEEVRRALV